MKHFFMCLAFQIEYNNHFLLIDFPSSFMTQDVLLILYELVPF